MKSPSGHTIASLDGLRGLAILLVLCFHWLQVGAESHLALGSSFLLYGAAFGFSGVMLFFVLSGFLLFLPYARAMLAEVAWPSAWQFYRRRMLRILPAYYFVLLVLLLLLNRTLLQNIGTMLAALLLLFDIRSALWWHVVQIDTPFWSLTVEWQFYLLLPWLAWVLARLASKRTRALNLVLGLAGVIVFGLLVRLLAALAHYQAGQNYPVDALAGIGLFFSLVFGMVGRYLEVFILGMAASLCYVWGVEQRHWLLFRQRIGYLCLLLACLGMAACVVWALAAHRLDFQPPFTANPIFSESESFWIIGEWLIGLCFALLLLGILFADTWPAWLFSLAPLRYCGVISYSLYLWHWPILWACVVGFPSTQPGRFWRFIVFTAGVLLVWCSASYYLIERPFLRWRRVARPLSLAQRYK